LQQGLGTVSSPEVRGSNLQLDGPGPQSRVAQPARQQDGQSPVRVPRTVLRQNRVNRRHPEWVGRVSSSGKSLKAMPTNAPSVKRLNDIPSLQSELIFAAGAADD
jgi:hypothetical protein